MHELTSRMHDVWDCMASMLLFVIETIPWFPTLIDITLSFAMLSWTINFGFNAWHTNATNHTKTGIKWWRNWMWFSNYNTVWITVIIFIIIFVGVRMMRCACYWAEITFSFLWLFVVVVATCSQWAWAKDLPCCPRNYRILYSFNTEIGCFTIRCVGKIFKRVRIFLHTFFSSQG